VDEAYSVFAADLRWLLLDECGHLRFKLNQDRCAFKLITYGQKSKQGRNRRKMEEDMVTRTAPV
jgi:hypothetical protein